MFLYVQDLSEIKLKRIQRSTRGFRGAYQIYENCIIFVEWAYPSSRFCKVIFFFKIDKKAIWQTCENDLNRSSNF